MTEEERKAHQEEERHQRRLRAYDDEILNLIWATTVLIYHCRPHLKIVLRPMRWSDIRESIEASAMRESYLARK
jgi:hypothetical protein